MVENHFFSYPIWHSEALYEHNDKLLEYCVLRKVHDKGRVLSNRGGWQSNDIFSNENALFSDFSSHLKKQIDSITERTKTKVKMQNFWININGYDDYNQEHVHPNSFLSGVYYVKAETTQGKICFRNPNKYINCLFFDTKNEFFDQFIKDACFQPITGHFIVFPSLLPHIVESNMTGLDRISISFNMRIDY